MNTIMRRGAVSWLLGLGLAMSAPAAHAQDGSDVLCISVSYNPESGDWSGACGKTDDQGGTEYFYSYVSVHPNDDGSSDLTFNVTDHGDCSSDAPLKCDMTTTGFDDHIESEGDYNYHIDAYVPGVWILCSCGGF